MAIVKFLDADLEKGTVKLLVVEPEGSTEATFRRDDWIAFRKLVSEIGGIVTEYPAVCHLMSLSDYDSYSRPKASAAYRLLWNILY